MNRPLRTFAALLWLATSPAQAADLCDGTCRLLIDFTNGGSISTSNGATITFAANGSLDTGSGGSINPGTGGSVTPANGDMSGGGSVVLGSDGGITFGADGSLDTAPGGGVTVPDGSALTVTSARFVGINTDQNAHLGNVTNPDTASFDAGGTVRTGDTTTPIHIVMDTEDPGTSVAVVAGADISYNTLTTDPGDDGSEGGTSSGSLCSGSCPDGSVPSSLGGQPAEGSGSLDAALLAGLFAGLAGALRRRKPSDRR